MTNGKGTSEAAATGGAGGRPVSQLGILLAAYYAARRWDNEGCPTDRKLNGLGGSPLEVVD